MQTILSKILTKRSANHQSCYMKQLLLFSSLLILLSCNGQKEKETLIKDQGADKVVVHYNNKNYDSIFYMFSPEVKKMLPLNKTVEFFSSLKKDAGPIVKYAFIRKEQTTSWYKAEFPEEIYWLRISQNQKGEVDNLNFTIYDDADAAVTVSTIRNTTKMILPFQGEWFVFWGGDTKGQNYHVVNRAQKNAFDIMMVDENERSYKTDGKKNEDYYAFGQPIIAPCDAEVVTLTEGVKDNIPGEMNPAQLTGNTVVLKTAANEYILFAHLKLNSVKVKTGDKVKQGQEIGLCGNSGNTTEPHLHFHIQDKETMAASTGIKCYFEKIMVNGKEKADHSPVKGERIRNAY
jgi:hypothetical protein